MNKRGNVNSLVLGLLVFLGFGSIFAFGQILTNQKRIYADQKKMYEEVVVLKNQIDLVQKDTRQFSEFLAKVQQPPTDKQQPPPEDFTKVYSIPEEHSIVVGNKAAPIMVVKFTDLECPFCGRFEKPLAEAIAAYPQQVKYMLKNFPLPFHNNARPAAKAALAAGEQGKYAQMAETLLSDPKILSDARYRQVAKDLGLNMDQFEKDLKEKDAQYENILNKDTELGKSVGVRGTPTFYINGRKTTARSTEEWKAEFEAILKK